MYHICNYSTFNFLVEIIHRVHYRQILAQNILVPMIFLVLMHEFKNQKAALKRKNNICLIDKCLT